MKNNDLSKIRQNINRRKESKKKISNAQGMPLKEFRYLSQSHMEDEERHGFSPSLSGYNRQTEASPFMKRFLIRSVIATVLFFMMVLSVGNESKWLEQPQSWINYAMNEEFPFATVNAWYQARFGAPFAMETDLGTEATAELAALPVSGQVSQTFQENGEGILISSEEETEVVAVDAGTVLFAGNDRETGKTVIIQHADNSKSIYGHLTNINVHSYQSIQSNQKIGSYQPTGAQEAMYFAIEKDQQFLDPIKVIQVDEQS
ncbi:M23 family metallopeptidase [Gracilibacillus caseinilyticus]|uniref:M23 family metallopeptidase n=1 Tax=Gracilibacillus caseinilyticus TaxID=2932256 RepID=A0ABY4ES92_9BACI|nr:M23 family metallopeptidase [Gracilibacillus caseinilyticus]UOQ47301.1 M23 family metallopeptidase [Gracilibacillus caseinilyticus]